MYFTRSAIGEMETSTRFSADFRTCTRIWQPISTPVNVTVGSFARHVLEPKGHVLFVDAGRRKKQEKTRKRKKRENVNLRRNE